MLVHVQKGIIEITVAGETGDLAKSQSTDTGSNADPHDDGSSLQRLSFKSRV